MNQPTKDVLRDQLALAADRIIELSSRVAFEKSVADWLRAERARRWWRRFAWWRK